MQLLPRLLFLLYLIEHLLEMMNRCYELILIMVLLLLILNFGPDGYVSAYDISTRRTVFEMRTQTQTLSIYIGTK